MPEIVEFIPKSFPTDLLQHCHRKFYIRSDQIDSANKIHDIQVQEDDIFLIAPPNSGGKFMLEVVWLFLNYFNFDAAKKNNDKSLHLELKENSEAIMEDADSLTAPRLITSDLPLPMLPAQVWSKKPKLIYVFRDPKDARVSFYLNNRGNEESKYKSVEEFLDDDMAKSNSFEDFIEFYKLYNQPWVFYTTFEYLVSNLSIVISLISDFLNIQIADTQMDKMLQYFSTDDPKNSPKNCFVSNAKKIWRRIKRLCGHQRYEHDEFMGAAKRELSPEYYDKYDKWIAGELKKYHLTLEELLLTEDNKQNYEELKGSGNVVAMDTEAIEKSYNEDVKKNEMVDEDGNTEKVVRISKTIEKERKKDAPTNKVDVKNEVVDHIPKSEESAVIVLNIETPKKHQSMEMAGVEVVNNEDKGEIQKEDNVAKEENSVLREIDDNANTPEENNEESTIIENQVADVNDESENRTKSDNEDFKMKNIEEENKETEEMQNLEIKEDTSTTVSQENECYGNKIKSEAKETVSELKENVLSEKSDDTDLETTYL